MRGLTIIVADMSSERFRAALAIAGCQAALGGKARVFCQGEAVSVLREPIQGMEDDLHEDAGQPLLADLFEEALALGIEVIACQSGLDLANIDARLLDRRIAIGGLVGIMATLGDDRLVVA